MGRLLHFSRASCDAVTGNGRLTGDVELRSTRSGKSVATMSVASDRRDRQAPALFVGLAVWERQAEAAAERLVKGQAVSFSGRFAARVHHQRRRDTPGAGGARRRDRVRAEAARRRARHRRRGRRQQRAG